MISINNKQLDGLCYDFEYQVTDKDELANKICQLILGNCGHVSKVINGVSIRPRACFFPLFSFLPLWLHYNLNPLCVQY